MTPIMPRSRRGASAANDDEYRVGSSLSARVDSEELAAALNAFFADQRPRPSQASTILVALEDFLWQRGYLPEPERGD